MTGSASSNIINAAHKLFFLPLSTTVQANNAFLTIRSATTGAVVSGPTSLKTLFGSSTINFGDPRAMYDPVAGRFIINAYGVSGLSSWTYLATSKGSNPTTSGWWVFRVTNDVRTWSGCSATTRCFGDYPTLGQVRAQGGASQGSERMGRGGKGARGGDGPPPPPGGGERLCRKAERF